MTPKSGIQIDWNIPDKIERQGPYRVYPDGLFLDEQGLKEIRKFRDEGDFEKAINYLNGAIPSPAVAEEYRKIRSMQAWSSKKENAWRSVIDYLEDYLRFADKIRLGCIQSVNQEPPDHTKRDQELLQLARKQIENP